MKLSVVMSGTLAMLSLSQFCRFRSHIRSLESSICSVRVDVYIHTISFAKYNVFLSIWPTRAHEALIINTANAPPIEGVKCYSPREKGDKSRPQRCEKRRHKPLKNRKADRVPFHMDLKGAPEVAWAP